MISNLGFVDSKHSSITDVDIGRRAIEKQEEKEECFSRYDPFLTQRLSSPFFHCFAREIGERNSHNRLETDTRTHFPHLSGSSAFDSIASVFISASFQLSRLRDNII